MLLFSSRNNYISFLASTIGHVTPNKLHKKDNEYVWKESQLGWEAQLMLARQL